MSGAEVISVISGAVTIITASIQVYDQVKNAHSLPLALKEVRTRLPVLADSLRNIHQALEEADVTDEQLKPAKEAATGCHQKAVDLGKILDDISTADESSRWRRVNKAVKSLGKKSEVEVLSKGIAEDIRVLAENQAIKRSLREEQRAQIKEDLDSLDSQGTDPASNSYTNSGSGSINVMQGGGNQYSASDTAHQNVYHDKAYNISGGNFGKGPWD